MKYNTLCRVSNIERKSEHSLSTEGKREWDKPKVEYFESTLEVLDNSTGIEGQITVRERLDFGLLYKIFLDTDWGPQTIETSKVSSQKSTPDSVLDFSLLDTKKQA